MSSRTVKLDEEKSKMPVWVRRIVLAPNNLTVCGWLVQGPQPTCAPAQKSVINMIWLLAHSLLLLIASPHHDDWSKWFASSSPPTPLAYLLSEFQFLWVGVAKKVYN
jgi:hypothetical protein